MSAAELRKAAILMLSLPDEQALQLLAPLAACELEALVAELARIDDVSIEEYQHVLLEFARSIAGRSARSAAA